MNYLKKISSLQESGDYTNQERRCLDLNIIDSRIENQPFAKGKFLKDPNRIPFSYYDKYKMPYTESSWLIAASNKSAAQYLMSNKKR